MKRFLLLAAVLLAFAAPAQDVPVFDPAREAFLKMSAAERRAKFTDEAWRKSVGSGYSRIRWRAARSNEWSRWRRMDGVVNVRDLGGLRGLGGLSVRTGLVFRSAQFNKSAPYRTVTNAEGKKVRDYYGGCEATLTDGQVAAIARDFGIKTDLDLRGTGQCRGMTGSPLGPQVGFVNVPASNYAGIFSGEGAKRLADCLRVFVDAANYPIVFHCVKGADRTGSLAFVLQALLGVSAEDRLLDWELTAFSNPNPKFAHADRYDRLTEGLARYPGATDAEKAVAYVKSIGLTDADIAQIRKNLLAGSVAVGIAEPMADEIARENAHTAGRTVIAGKGLVRFALDRKNALYRCGDEATFTVTVPASNEVAATGGSVSWRLDNYGEHRFAEGKVDLARENPFIVRGTLPKPGFLRLTISDGKGRRLGAYSAAYEPERIRVAVPKPADFDSFWDEAVARLDREVPLDPRVESVPGFSRKGVTLNRVSFATVGGARVYGVLGLPTDLTKGPYPVDVHCPGAGPGFILKRCMNECSPDRISLFMSVHSFPVQATDAETKPLYDAQEAAWRKMHGTNRARAYPVGGLTVSRERGHYFDKILGINRAIDWVAHLPQADSRHVAYSGASQGGGMGLILAGLNKSLTHGYMGVPAMCDLVGCKADGRQSGWPRITEYETQPDAARLATIQSNARYFDAAYFAERIRIPVRLSVGYADESCAPHSVLAAYNAIPSSDKRLYHGIGGLHGSPNAPRAEIDAWLRADVSHLKRAAR